MAIDKSHTKPWMKAVIIFIALTFVIGIGFTGAIGACSAVAPTPTTNAPTGSATTSQTVDSIGLQFTPIIQALEASITVEPENYDLLVAQGGNYYDWGSQVREAVQTVNPGQDAPIWKSAALYYGRALKVKSGDKTVMGDYAVSQFYSGDATAAIVTGEQVRALDTTFAPNLFNLGIFYQSTGDAVKAKAAYEAYLAAEPSGDMAQAAKDNLAALAQP